MGITTLTTSQKGRELLHTIQELAKLRPTPQPFLAVQVNILKEGKMVDTHLDKFNHTTYPTWTMSMGEFQGGNLRVENYGEDHPPTELQEPGKVLNGKMIVGQWNSFDPRHKHGVTKVTKGERVSISLYTPTRPVA
eukprot:1013861-Amphidinium_carterae.1